MERELARARDFDLAVEDHGFLVLSGHFDCGGTTQGLGYQVDADFLKRFLGVFGVEYLRQVNGRPCYVLREGFDCPIKGIEPLFPGEGKPFLIDDWAAKFEVKDPSAAVPRLLGALQQAEDWLEAYTEHRCAPDGAWTVLGEIQSAIRFARQLEVR